MVVGNVDGDKIAKIGCKIPISPIIGVWIRAADPNAATVYGVGIGSR